jgi:LPXTG-motif cell wall-anchored protein
MSTNLVRSLIAGSVAAVSSITFFAAPAAHASSGLCIPTVTVNGDGTISMEWPDSCSDTGTPPAIGLLDPAIIAGLPDLALPPVIGDPPLCVQLDLSNLTVLAAQTSPDDWQWRFRIEGDTNGLCDDVITTEMVDLDASTSSLQSFTVYDVLAENALGNDFVSTFATPCHYTTTAYFGAAMTQLDQYVDIHKETAACLPAVEVPGPGEIPGLPTQPETPATPQTPETPDTPQVTVPSNPGDQRLPHTGSDNTVVVIGLGLLVLGAGLGFTALSMSRRRHIA